MGKIEKGYFDPDEMPKWLSAFFKKSYTSNVIAGINDDDCAIIKIGKEEIVISTDYLNANPIAKEFNIGTFKDLGKLLVAANLSDLCGTGAKPVGFLTSLMFNKQESRKNDFLDFMRGVKKELNKHKVPLLGGDTKLGNSNSFCGVAIGKRERGTKLFLKNSAKVGDLIWVSSYIGDVSAAITGLKLGGMGTKWEKWAKACIVRPKLPLNLSIKLAKSKVANGGTDISDGLGADLCCLCEASNVGAVVWVEKLPVSKNVRLLAKKQGLLEWYYPFCVGGDFQFIATAAKSDKRKMEKLGFKKIGEIIQKKETTIIYKDEKFTMPRMGHRDLKTSSFSTEMESLLTDITKLLRV